MRKIKAFLFFMALATGLFAQNKNVETVHFKLKNDEIEDAKKYIDLAAEHEQTANSPKMWYYRGKVYWKIHSDSNYRNLDPKALAKATESFYQNLSSPKPFNRDESKFILINCGFESFNNGVKAYTAGDFPQAIENYKQVLKVLPFDSEKDLIRNNVSDKVIYQYIAFAAIEGKDFPQAKENLQKLIDAKYNDPQIYVSYASILLEERDTVAAQNILDLGRKNHPDNQNLIYFQVQLYDQQGKTNVLIAKLSEAITQDPSNPKLYAIRAINFDKINEPIKTRMVQLKENVDSLDRLIKKTVNAAEKTKLASTRKSWAAKADSLEKVVDANELSIEADYKKAIEIEADYLLPIFNLGALYNNKASRFTDKMNALHYTQEKEFNELKKQQEAQLKIALDYFSKALTISESMPESTPEEKSEKKAWMKDILYSLQQVHANLGNYEKSTEMRKRKEAL